MGYESLPDICEVVVVNGPEVTEKTRPTLLFEIPHGATELSHLEAVCGLLGCDVEVCARTFWGMTDQGVFAYSHRLAQFITDPAWVEHNCHAFFTQAQQERAQAQSSRRQVVLLRGILPRNLVDLNRAWLLQTQGERKFTGVLGDVVREAGTTQQAKALYDAYQALSDRAHADVCGRGGYAFQLHTYAPISVPVPQEKTVEEALEHAYRPEHYDTFPKRPIGQLITGRPDAEPLTERALVQRIQDMYARVALEIPENSPFALDPVLAPDARMHNHAGRVVGFELSRGALSPRFWPFAKMEVDPDKVDALVTPLAQAIVIHNTLSP